MRTVRVVSSSLGTDEKGSEVEKGTAGWVLRALLELLALCCLLLLAAMLGGVAIIAWECYRWAKREDRTQF